MTTAAVAQLEKQAAEATVEAAHETLQLNFVELAAALRVDRRTLYRYRNGASVPSPRVRLRLEKLRAVNQLLEEVFETTESQLEWLHTPVPLLRGGRPIDLMRRGELESVASVLAGLYSGSHA